VQFIRVFFRRLVVITPAHRAYRNALRELTLVCDQLLAENERLKRNYDVLLAQLNSDPSFGEAPLLQYIMAGGGVRMKDIRERFRVSYPTAKKLLDLMIEDGRIEKREKKYYDSNDSSRKGIQPQESL